MLVASLVLTLNFALFHHTPRPAPTCGITTVSYRFSGEPGAEFLYAGTKYVVPASGWIELLAHRKANYTVSGRALPLDVWPIDEFGTRHVPLPALVPHTHDNDAAAAAGGTK